MSTTAPVCIAVLPSKLPGDLTGVAGRRLDRLYEAVIIPAAAACGTELVRLDPAVSWPVTQRQLLDNLLLSDTVIFDISDQVPELLYLLGIRLALRSEATILLARADAVTSETSALPAPLLYRCTESGEISPSSVQGLVAELSSSIATVHSGASAIGTEYYELLSEYRTLDIARTKTDRFRSVVRYRMDFKTRLSRARSLGLPDSLLALRSIQSELVSGGPEVDSAIFVDLLLSYRAEGSWEDVRRLYDCLPLPLKRSVMIREQYALALNRLGMREEALGILEKIEAVQGPSSETCSLIGRVYKDLWQDCEKKGDRSRGAIQLKAAINAYRRGFHADWRDAYPGINLVTLLDLDGEAASLLERDRVLPIVRFAVEQRIAKAAHDYWDYATLLELAVIEEDRRKADCALTAAIENVAEGWQPETTANNLRLLHRYRLSRGQDVGWIDSILSRLGTAMTSR